MSFQTAAKRVKRSSEAIMDETAYSRMKRIPFPWDEGAPNNFMTSLEKILERKNIHPEQSLIASATGGSSIYWTA